jgi:general secretion pathway protein L
MQFGNLLKQAPWSWLAVSPTELLENWQRALVECLPPTLRKPFVKEQARMVLALTGDGAQARLEQGGEVQPVEVPVRSDAADLRNLAARAEQVAADVVLTVPSEAVLRRQFRLPVQVKDNLDRVVAYEIDRLTPFSGDEIYFDYRLLPSQLEDQLLIDLAALKRARVDAWIQGLAGAGRAARQLLWPDAWDGANLLPSSARRENRGDRFVLWTLWTLVLVLTAAVLVTPLLQKRQIVIDLGERLVTVRTKANQVAELRERLNQAVSSANYLVEKKRTALYVSDLVRKLTELVPDHTWVNQLNLNDRTVDFRGDSKDATGMIEVLAAEPTFKKISFKSPVVGIANTDRERFHIELEYTATRDSG